MRTFSGMPECKLGLNDRVLLEAQGRTPNGNSIDLDDIRFHRCVRLTRFENDRTISFILPDGSFDLISYRLSSQVKPLIWVEALIEKHARSRIEMVIKARSQFKERSTATNVQIDISVPCHLILQNLLSGYQWDLLLMLLNMIHSEWKIGFFPGSKEYMLRAEFSLPSVASEDVASHRKAPIHAFYHQPGTALYLTRIINHHQRAIFMPAIM